MARTEQGGLEVQVLRVVTPSAEGRRPGPWDLRRMTGAPGRDWWAGHPHRLTAGRPGRGGGFSPEHTGERALCGPHGASARRVVKEEISADNARLPCFNGRVVSWVSLGAVAGAPAGAGWGWG